MTLVIDASLVVAALVDGGDVGRWAEQTLLADHLAINLMPINLFSRAVGVYQPHP